MATEELNTASRIFRARLKDGSTILYKAQWHGFLDLDWHEDGAPSTWDHPIDTRRCAWTAGGRIVRSVAVVVAGQDYWNDALTTVFQQHGTGEGSSFMLGSLRSENCNDCANRREGDFQNMRDHVNGALDAVLADDLPKVVAGIKGLPDIVELNAQA